MLSKSIFSTQRSSGQIPTLMANNQEKRMKWVDTLAITMVAAYLAQLHRHWQTLWGSNIQRSLDFIQHRVYEHEIEDFKVWHFNCFYPPDWEDTSFAIYLLVKNNRLEIDQLENLRGLLLFNTTEQGTGIWVKDPYSSGNAERNYWDPTSAINILRLHYLLETEKSERGKVEKFIKQNLVLENFGKTTLYYTPPVTAFFIQRLIEDFPNLTEALVPAAKAFHREVTKAVIDGFLPATFFEKALLGLPTQENDYGLIFHHAKRNVIWYGSPVLHALAQTVL